LSIDQNVVGKKIRQDDISAGAIDAQAHGIRPRLHLDPILSALDAEFRGDRFFVWGQVRRFHAHGAFAVLDHADSVETVYGLAIGVEQLQPQPVCTSRVGRVFEAHL
jgi:hypothetical protein